MSKIETLRKQYSQLTADERFKAWLAALARDDDEERIALVASCPRLSYRMRDFEFQVRMYAVQFNAADAAMQMLAQGLVLGMAMGAAWQDIAPGELEDLMDAGIRAARTMAAISVGFEAWCSDVGIEPEDALCTAASRPILEAFDTMLGTAQRLDAPGPEEAARWRAKFAGLWGEKVEAGN